MIEQKRSLENLVPLEIYTDGSSRRFGRTMLFGGWGFVALRNGIEIQEEAGSELGATNQRMELLAIRNALKFAEKNRLPNERVVIYSDSAYAINCYNDQWYLGWENNGWLNSKGEDVANKELWFEIIPYYKKYWYTFLKVKGHGDNYWNNLCDTIAQKASNDLKIHYQGEHRDVL